MKTSHRPVKVGLIGLGAMGGAVGRRLLESGVDLTVHDISAAAVESLTALGARAVDTAEELASADVILVSLPNDDIVEGVLLGDGLLKHLSGKIVVELSTILPETIRGIHDVAREHDITLIDCPVSGGPGEAMDGKLVLMVGCEPHDLEAVRPIIEPLGSVEHVGPVGAGKVVKIVNNMMSMGNLVVAAEAFSLGTRLGLDPTRLYEILSTSGGRSGQLVKRFPYVLANDYHARFALSLAEKDLRLALSMGHAAKFPLPVAANIHQMYEMGVALGTGDQDQVAVIKLYDQWAADPKEKQDR
jgi:3-hydroxyisobutyrate dehydrogenase